MRVILLFAVLISFSGYSQTSNDAVIEHYRNGNFRFKSHKIDDSTTMYLEYSRNGYLKDSAVLRNEVPIGKRVMFHRNGRKRYVIAYKSGTDENNFEHFRRNGSLKATGGNLMGESFGPHFQYNRKGVAVKFRDMNKGKNISVPEQYRKGEHLTGKAIRSRLPGTKATLKRESKSVNIRTGALLSLRLKGETEFNHHYQVEGFSKDSMLVSKFRYDISRSRNTLAFDSNDVIGFHEIDAIFFGKNKSNTAEVVALAITTAGVILLFEPILIAPILQGIEALAEPAALATMGSGIVLTFWGKHLQKKTVPKEYKMAEWKIQSKGL